MTHTSDTKLTVLMVEDEEDTADMLRFLLEREQYRVLSASTGRHALALIDHNAPPDLVLLDVILPFVNGLQLLTYIRSKAEWATVPVLMLTADGSEHDVRRALQSGATDYLLKPFKPQELCARLRRYLPPKRVSQLRVGD